MSDYRQKVTIVRLAWSALGRRKLLLTTILAGAVGAFATTLFLSENSAILALWKRGILGPVLGATVGAALTILATLRIDAIRHNRDRSRQILAIVQYLNKTLDSLIGHLEAVGATPKDELMKHTASFMWQLTQIARMKRALPLILDKLNVEHIEVAIALTELKTQLDFKSAQLTKYLDEYQENPAQFPHDLVANAAVHNSALDLRLIAELIGEARSRLREIIGTSVSM